MGRLARGVAAIAVGAAPALAAAALAACGANSANGVNGVNGHSGSSTTASALPAALVREARPIGRGARFHPPAMGPVVGPCRRRLGSRRGVHVEVFAADRVVIIPAGIGTEPPRSVSEGRISHARCYGTLVTVEPTGVVLVRRGATPMLAALLRSWGQPLSSRRLVSFSGPVSVFVGGRRWPGPPGSVPLRPHSEIVLEVGPHVPPHTSYTFPPGS